MFRSKAFTFFTHVLCWLLFFSLPVLFLNQRSETEQFTAVIKTAPYWLFYGCYILLFYLHASVLLPYLFLKKRYFSYSFSILILFTAFYFLRPFDTLISHVSRTEIGSRPPGAPPATDRPFPPDRRDLPPPVRDMERGAPHPGNPNVRLDIVSLFLFVMIVALSMAVEITQQWRTTQQRALQAEADQANAELSFLKAQINPHFLFNILNNIYALAVTKSDNTASAILKLSNLMRYITDEATADFVDLTNEVACIRDYIALQQLRLSKKVQINFSVEGDLEHKKIVPLVLITFIENVFKFGISNREASVITIALRADKQAITFYCQNPIFPHQAQPERAGIGLANTSARLNHLYPGTHTLNITTINGFFTVQLTLPV